jgi:hypothetical protein
MVLAWLVLFFKQWFSMPRRGRAALDVAQAVPCPPAAALALDGDRHQPTHRHTSAPVHRCTSTDRINDQEKSRSGTVQLRLVCMAGPLTRRPSA